jgi:hypothetical protein
MSGAIPPLPQYALMAWGSVKAQGKLYLYLFKLKILVPPLLKINTSCFELYFQHSMFKLEPF